jgi:dTDP-4-dehydrorhamnose 3,5-epimerase
MIDVRRFDIAGPLEIIPKKRGDARGFFSETFNQADFAAHGIDEDWVQDNHVWSTEKGILRGLHFQKPPHAQAKLVRVCRGRIFDVAVDIREGSPSFGKWLGVELSAERWNMLYVPVGFAHGYLTLGEAEVIYKVSQLWAPGSEQAIRFDDPAVGVDWPLPPAETIVSEKDRHAGTLAEAAGIFVGLQP